MSAVKGARVRTESMAQRLSKQPMSEGYTLMDRGYNLGAMRLLTFKAENAPPFQLAPCLEAIATIFLRMDEGADAQENFGYAAEKYAMIGQGVLAEVMKIRGIEATAGTEAALALAEELVAKADPEGSAVGMPESKQKANIARAYHLRADLRMQMGQIEEAIADAQMAGAIGWDRVFEAHFVLGLLHLHKEDLGQAEAALSQCVQLNPHYFAGFEALVDVLMRAGDGKQAQLLQVLDKAIELHPRAELIRKKAFTMSDTGSDAAAIEMLDKYIANPPHEEAEALFTQQGVAVATFNKAKAAIYADQKNFTAAKAAAEAALAASKDDLEAQALLKDISEVAKAE